jgi:hypothetical protein
MNNNLQELQDLYQTELGNAALTYLEIGLAVFHGWDPELTGSRVRLESDFHPHPQAALGNLAIAVELMLKAFIASKHLSLLFKDPKDLPLETRTILTCSDTLPPNFNWRAFGIELRSSYKTIDLGECISIFYVFYPEQRWLESDLKLLRSARNASVHAFLPSFQQYELEQAARVALRIHDVLQEAQVFEHDGYEYSDFDKLFVDRFDKEQIRRVRSKIDEATKLSKSIDDSSIRIIHALGDWDHFVIPCPVCRCDCMLAGDTHMLTSSFDEDRPSLSFAAGSLQCSHCGLALNNSGELRLAGVGLFYNRSDELDLYLRYNDN